MAVSRQTSSGTELEVAPPTPCLAVLSPPALSPVDMSILGQVVPVVGDLVLMAGDVQARAVPVRAPLVDVIGCWLQTWVMRSQKTLRTTPSQRLRPNRPHLLCFRLSNDNSGSLRKMRRGFYTRTPWLVLNRYKVSSRYLPLSQAHRFIRFVKNSTLPLHR